MRKELYMQALFILNLIIPFVMVLIGTILRKHSVLDRNGHNGYNTPISRKSQKHWEYAQKIAPNIYISFGKYLFAAEIIVSLVLLLLHVSVIISVIIGESIGFACLFFSFYYTDRKIREKFADK